jgi:hypothetical protein
MFLRQSVLKLNSLKYKGLFCFDDAWQPKKMGTPRNEGESA